MAISLSTFLESTFQGAQGVQGVQGTQGVGSQGAQGIQGGLSSQGTIGSQGAVGSQGAQGVQGVQGFSPVGIPSSSNTTLGSTDAGKVVIIDANVAINASTAFSIGDMCTIYNVGITTRTITPSTVTLRWAGTTSTGTRSLSPKGLGNILCVASDDYVISGAGLT